MELGAGERRKASVRQAIRKRTSQRALSHSLGSDAASEEHPPVDELAVRAAHSATAPPPRFLSSTEREAKQLRSNVAAFCFSFDTIQLRSNPTDVKVSGSDCGIDHFLPLVSTRDVADFGRYKA